MKFCEKPFNTLRIDPCGDVRLCGWLRQYIGNLVTDGVEEIWTSERAEKVRDSIRNGTFEYCQPESCPFLQNDSLPDLEEKEFTTRAVRTERPEFVDAACDYTCNHSCPSCRAGIFVGDENYKSELDIVINKLYPFIDTAKHFMTDGQGDAFASPYIMKMLERIHPADETCIVGIETNGALFDERHWERIKHLGNYDLRVTVTPNSFEPTTFKYLNGGHNTYENVMHNLAFIRDLRRQGKVKRFAISMVIQDRNFWEFPSFVKRCLEEFEADEVVAKPLYYWFGISEEMHWFKDVFNPQHPYHAELLKMMQDPILEDKRVFFWGAHNLHESKAHPAYRYRDFLNMGTQLLTDDAVAKRLKDYFANMGQDEVYVYGDIDFSELFIAALKKAGIGIKGIIARDIKRKEISGIPVTCLCDYKPENSDAVVVLAYYFFRQIKRDFGFYGHTCNLIRLDELMRGLTER